MINVDGFLFEDEEKAELACKEAEGILFIKQRTALDNPEVVLKLYKRLLEKELFVTPVGIRFLTELQDMLYNSGYIARKEIPPILVKKTESTQGAEIAASVEDIVEKRKIKKKIDSRKEKDYQKPFYAAVVVAIIMTVSVIGMFVISAISGNNVNIINYREQLLNEYSSWEAELKEEAQRLEAWEETLEEREEKLNSN